MNASSTRSLTAGQREALRTALERQIEHLRAALARGPLPNHNEETDDEAVADLETSLEVAGLERSSAELKEAIQALRRLGDAAYGTCADCGIDIPYLRLLASPTATRCIACQRSSERGAPPSGSL